ncbi:uncharacterized protein LOC133831742 [Humulus lupulus]|uniref:uncharacterized protein LOC133831742 n=1 Tax=Humulus lupulus TaxID=3486 RepID=UPI002B403F44|nr:uncharacterized protein LOC133831742 [Humulus lupulus]
MPCSKEEALVRLFYNASSSFQLLLLFSSFSFIFLTKFFHFIGSNPIFPRSQYSHEYTFSDEEEEEEDQEEEEVVENQERVDHCFDYHHQNQDTDHDHDHDHLVADIICGGEALFFLPNDNNFGFDTLRGSLVNDNDNNNNDNDSDEYFTTPQESLVEEEDQNDATELLSMHDTDTESDHDQYDDDHHNNNHSIIRNSVSNNNNQPWPTSPVITIGLRSGLVNNNDQISHEYDDYNKVVESTKFSSGDEKFLSFGPTQLEISSTKNEKDDRINGDDEVYGDSCTVGSTSKSSSEWRSSINYRDSGTDDPFSSSSRRSCPKWESYTVFQKYDEEMMFFDRISAQKLHETESLRSIKVSPRSVSERIVHTISMINNKTPKDIHRNPYHELEAAYVAQICLTWEALNWNYKKFQEKRSSRRSEYDPGCPGQIAQQFQQFQVLLQRYIENEPYEHGRRPEIYARMRLLAPKLLQVPEYRDSVDDQRDDEGVGSRISSPAFLIIMEDCIHTFMNFLKADKENTCQIITSLFRRKRRRGSLDPTLLQLIKKVNQKKKMKLKDLRRARKCLRRRRLKVDEGMEIVMGLIDLKVVSRVLRMKEMSEEQMHWCEEKMSKVKILDGKLQRDSSTLFFPSH